eukprot:5545570-Amphidinium_carterae.2
MWKTLPIPAPQTPNGTMSHNVDFFGVFPAATGGVQQQRVVAHDVHYIDGLHSKRDRGGDPTGFGHCPLQCLRGLQAVHGLRASHSRGVMEMSRPIVT